MKTTIYSVVQRDRDQNNYEVLRPVGYEFFATKAQAQIIVDRLNAQAKRRWEAKQDRAEARWEEGTREFLALQAAGLRPADSIRLPFTRSPFKREYLVDEHDLIHLGVDSGSDE